MTTKQDEIKIGLVGPKAAGKSSMFQTFHEALDRGRHGYPRAFDPQVRLTGEPTRIEGLTHAEYIERMINQPGIGEVRDEAERALLGHIATTDHADIVTRHYELSYHEPGGRRERTVVRMAITDAAGEHSFRRKTPDALMETVLKPIRAKLYAELATCVGFVVVVPFSEAIDSVFIERLDQWLHTLSNIAADRHTDAAAMPPRPVVVALTRYDALFTDFGSEAFRIAADPRVATDIVNRLVSNTQHGATFRKNVAKYDVSEGGRFKIVFVPTSSFGFVPGFGCPNLDPNVNPEVVQATMVAGESTSSFKVSIPAHPNQHLFPFLTADPFIYAATGIANPFFVAIERAKRREPFVPEDRTAWIRSRPRESGSADARDRSREQDGTGEKAGTSGPAGPGGDAPRDRDPKPNGRRFDPMKWIKKLDYEL